MYPPEEFDALLDTIWNALIAGAESHKDGFHLAQVATCFRNEPRLRTVVLRDADRESRTLTFHTDFRASKICELTENPIVAWHFYDPDRKVQLRVRAIASVHNQDDLARERWEASRLSSRRCYRALRAPGTVVEEPVSGLPAELEGRSPTEEEAEPGFENFAVVRTNVEQIVYLFLAGTGHRSARFSWDGTRFVPEWLSP